ncbi:MAG: hypothetical protein A2Y20_07560 [Firmicutes bacterium GWF2_51_9]|jgi:hypothetical protein|nr:MAG: hypothetical protein A2Y20_07560 [Firmicutes bacterium GWF2_51_9]OGS59653.1 MAG: hypothetical protein A2Y19_01895 [Firmicutes bacterium GWE2_51_13]HAM63061.1 hypothetical protein [Erysipelotrichaceae bacterium]HAO60857.1 hypothetical protein [Erysipelotrichaceae bacterium]HBZ41582.1 hypothetical protein [Erysipelotrichaceae bacterium]
MATKINPRKTAGRLVLDTFKEHRAFSEKTAQPAEICKDLPLSSNVIAYTITNMMADNILIRTEDNRFYYSEENWNKFQTKFNRVYWVIIGIPVVVFIVLYAIQALGLLKFLD